MTQLGLAFRVIGNDQFDRVQNGNAAVGHRVQIIAQGFSGTVNLAGIRAVVQGADAVVWLVTYISRADVDIETGNNAGKSMVYTQVVTGRQALAVSGQRRGPLCQPEAAQGIGSDPGLAGWADERDRVQGALCLPANCCAGWQGQGFDTQQSQIQRLVGSEAQAAFEHRRHRPAGTSQLHVVVLIETFALAWHQLSLCGTGQQRIGPCVVGACLVVEGLHPRPQGGGQPQTGENADALQRVASPVAGVASSRVLPLKVKRPCAPGTSTWPLIRFMVGEPMKVAT